VHDPRPLRLDSGDDLQRVDVARRVVDEDDLGSGTGLPLDAVERFEQGAPEIVTGDDRGDAAWRHARPCHCSQRP
jgi:hypothetical protein